jgi:hypothetical protein
MRASARRGSRLRRSRSFLLVLVTLLSIGSSAVTAHAQSADGLPGYSHSKWTTQDGLPQNLIPKSPPKTWVRTGVIWRAFSCAPRFGGLRRAAVFGASALDRSPPRSTTSPDRFPKPGSSRICCSRSSRRRSSSPDQDDEQGREQSEHEQIWEHVKTLRKRVAGFN